MQIVETKFVNKLTVLQSCLIVQTACMAFEHDPVKRYNYGCLNALAFALQTAAICIRMVMLLSYSSSFWSHEVYVVLDVLQLCAAVVCCLACLSLPRRPVVEEGGTLVDGQYTISAFGRYTFTWAGATFALARKKKTLGLEDLPKLHKEGRSTYRQQYLGTLKERDQLWKTLLFAHLPEICFQIGFSTLQSTAEFMPQLVMYFLLKRLESRSIGASADVATWGLVIALGLAIILSSWTQAWLHWMIWARLGQLVRIELSTMIFSKATRRKDVKGVQKSEQVTGVNAKDEAVISPAILGTNDQKTAEQHPMTGSTPGQTEMAKAEDSLEDDVQESHQSTINLVVKTAPFTRRIQVG